LESIVAAGGTGIATMDESGRALNFSLQGARLAMTNYRLWMAEGQEDHFLRSWVIEGSLGGDQWSTLGELSETEILIATGASATFPVENTKAGYFDQFRLRQTGPNSTKNDILQLARIELFGDLQYDPKAIEPVETDTSRNFSFSAESDGETATNQGLVQFLSQGSFGQSSNPVLTGKLAIQASSEFTENVEAWEVFAEDPRVLSTASGPDQWIAFRLLEGRFDLKFIDLGIGKDESDFPLSEFVIEGSNNQGDWIELAKIVEKTEREAGDGFVRFAIPEQAGLSPFAAFRVRTIGSSSMALEPVRLTGIELYGTAYDDSLTADRGDDFCSPNTFPYEPGFSTGGVIRALGREIGSLEWMNPAFTGKVIPTASSLAGKSGTVTLILGEDAGYVSTESEANAWMAIEFSEGEFSPTHYSLRHIDSADSQALRNWKFQASNDGVQWFTLREHVDDESLNESGQTMTWNVNQTFGGQAFRHFRVLATGLNASGDRALAISGIELYGDYCVPFGDFVPEPSTEDLEFDDDFGTNGIFYQLGTANETASYTNPVDFGLVEVSASSLTADSEDAASILDRRSLRCVTRPVRNSSFTISLNNRRVIPTHYSLRHYSSWDTEALRNWVLEASNDEQTWVVLREHIDDNALNGKGDTASWSLSLPPNSGSFRHFRVRQTGRNSNGHYYLALSGFELYGTLETSPDENFQIPALPILPKEGTDFIYDSDFDGNGVVAYLATNDGLSSYVNPVDLGLMSVTASSLMPNSEPARSVVGDVAVRCVTRALPNSFFEIEFSDLKVQPTHYSLRYYSSFDTEALRDWVFEGSVDGVSWRLLSRHIDDASLNRKGGTQTWQLTDPENRGFYRCFRIRQTGLNSNRHHYLALSGFEIYGKVVALESEGPLAEAPVPPAGNVPLLLENSAPAPGVFERLGTDNGNRPFFNPAFTGQIDVTASTVLGGNSPSEPLGELLSQNDARVVTQPLSGSWVAFDLRENRLIPTAYALKHYSTWDTEAIRSWDFQGSNDGQSWITLDSQNNNDVLNIKNEWATFLLPAESQAYRLFRIRQTGRNSNNHHYLALGAVELYGQLTNENFRKSRVFNQWLVDEGISFDTINLSVAGAVERQQLLIEYFAYGPGSEFQRQAVAIVEADGQQYGAFTFPVRIGALPIVASPGDIEGAGAGYTILARSSVAPDSTSLAMTEVVPAVIPEDWPPAGAGYDYRTYRIIEPIANQEKVFFFINTRVLESE
jgi:hypothetical protein